MSDRLANLLHVCRPCHDQVHAGPAASREAGWLLGGRDDPALVALLYRGEACYLADDGRVALAVFAVRVRPCFVADDGRVASVEGGGCVMGLATQTARARLRVQMDSLFAADRGLGVLVEDNGRPGMSERAKRMQMAWAAALVAVHGSERAAAVYAQYASDRRREVARTVAPVGSWQNLVLGTKPLPAWTRDIHGFLCVGCGEAFPQVLVDGLDPMCRVCARATTTPDQVAPLWQAFSHGRFEFPGVLREEVEELGDTSATVVSVRYGDGETRTYTGGDASLLFPGTRGLPSLVQGSAWSVGESRDTIGLVIEARTGHARQGFDILARFSYDPRPEGDEPHPYGFRFEAARLTPTNATEYTDLYDLLDALIAGLYGEVAAVEAVGA